MLLKHILGEVQRVNKKFEVEVQDPTILLSNSIHLIDSISSKIVIPGDSVENYLSPHPYLGYEFEKETAQCRFPDEKHIRGRCMQFVVELVKQLRQHLPDSAQELQSMSSLSASECLQLMKPGILELAKMFTENGEILTCIEFQWRKLHHIFWKQH